MKSVGLTVSPAGISGFLETKLNEPIIHSERHCENPTSPGGDMLAARNLRAASRPSRPCEAAARKDALGSEKLKACCSISLPTTARPSSKIGRASCRERG